MYSLANLGITIVSICRLECSSSSHTTKQNHSTTTNRIILLLDLLPGLGLLGRLDAFDQVLRDLGLHAAPVGRRRYVHYRLPVLCLACGLWEMSLL